jgi:hypothetical protein
VEAEMAERTALENQICTVLNRILRIPSAVKNVQREGNLSLLFGAISTSCPQYNKMWRKCAARSLITVCRYSERGGEESGEGWGGRGGGEGVGKV